MTSFHESSCYALIYFIVYETKWNSKNSAFEAIKREFNEIAEDLLAHRV